MTTALVPYNPPCAPEPDAGRGLRFTRGGWLVSTPCARHVRWLSLTCQAVISDVWNLPVLAVHTLIRDEWWRHRVAFVASAVVVVVLILAVDPLLGAGVGFLLWCLCCWKLARELTETREVGA